MVYYSCMNQRIDITPRTMLTFIGILAGIWLLYSIRDILLLLLVSFIFMSALRPFVDVFEKIHVPRPIGIIVVYILVIGIFGISFGTMIPSLVGQVAGLFGKLPNVAERVIPGWQFDNKLFTDQIAPISENVVRFTVDMFSNIFSVFSVLVFTFYFLLERQHLKKLLNSTFGEKTSDIISTIIHTIEYKLGQWMRGQFILMLVIGVFTYIGLVWLRVDYALPLAIIAGMLEVVPIIGPVISAIPAVILSLAVSPFFALAVVILYFLIQQLENHIIVPLVMKKSTGLPPLVTLLSIMIGGRFAGLSGAILSVPIVLMLQIIIGYIITNRTLETS
jgi:predicted PurR-regulated permease PerM